MPQFGFERERKVLRLPDGSSDNDCHFAVAFCTIDHRMLFNHSRCIEENVQNSQLSQHAGVRAKAPCSSSTL